MNQDLRNKLSRWNGIHIEYLKALYEANSSDVDFFEDLVTICANEQGLQVSATWLIKHHYDNGNALPETLTERLLAACKSVGNSEAKLHLLQLLPHFNLTDKSIATTDDFVRECLADKNKFVKAWAYNGLYVLTKYLPELKNELAFICERAMQTESAAIKSKVRKILFELNKK